MNEIKAIETEYNGYRFRSRLEARWAVFFDVANIKYVYETEGYENEDGERYLPDFYLPDFDIHCEVKGNHKWKYNGIMKAKSFIVWGGPIKAILFLGEIPKWCNEGIWYFPMIRYASGYGKDAFIESVWFSFYCNKDGSLTGHATKRNYEAPFHQYNGKIYGIKTDDGYEDISFNAFHESQFIGGNGGLEICPLLYHALDSARQARFEYGEN